jgi:cell division inhibitor SulA
MPKYVIERVVPGASKMSPAELKTLSQRSCNVLNQLGLQIQYCVYVAPNEELVREHARLGGFPANHVAQVKTIIDPTTSEE